MATGHGVPCEAGGNCKEIFETKTLSVISNGAQSGQRIRVSAICRMISTVMAYFSSFSSVRSISPKEVADFDFKGHPHQ